MPKVKNLNLYAEHVSTIFRERYKHRRHNRSFRLTIDKHLTKGPFSIKLWATGKRIKSKVIYDQN